MTLRRTTVKILRFDRQDEAIAWAKKRIGIEGMTGSTAAISLVDDDGEFLAATVYSAYTRTNIDMHIAAKPGYNWLSRSYFNASFELPFLLLEVPRITGLIRPKNRIAQRFVKRLGFKYEGRIRKAFPDGDDVMLYGFLREEYLSHPWRTHENDREPSLLGRLPKSQGDSPVTTDSSPEP